MSAFIDFNQITFSFGAEFKYSKLYSLVYLRIYQQE